MIYLVMSANHPKGGSDGLMVVTFDPVSWKNLLNLPTVVRLHEALEMRLKVTASFIEGSKSDLVGFRGQELVEAVAYGLPAASAVAVAYGEPERLDFFAFRSMAEHPAFKGDVVLLSDFSPGAVSPDEDLVIIVPDRRMLRQLAPQTSQYAH